MSIVEKKLHKPDSAQQERMRGASLPGGHSSASAQKQQAFFSLRVVVLLGLVVGAALVVAVILFIGKVPNETPAITLVEQPDTDTGPINRTQSGSIVSQASATTSQQASAEQAPTTVATAKPKAEAQPDVEADVRRAVVQWAEAWSRKDSRTYLASYAGDFSVPDGLSRAAWEAQRKLRIAKPHSIKVVLKQVAVSLSADGIATVHFVQDYRADSFHEAGVKKELRLKNENGRWLILSEKAA